MEKTENLGLNIPKGTEFFDVEHQNENMLLLDAIIQVIREVLAEKVDAIAGKGLSTNDYTTDEKEKLAGVATGANKYTHPTSGVTAGTYRSVTVDDNGHVTGGSNPTTTVTQGGTGATTVAGARNALGLGNTSGALPIANGGTGATTKTAALTNLGITATAAELNKMDGVTATTTELNYVDGVTSAIQTQLNGKATASTGTFTLTYSGSTVMTGTYDKIGKFVYLRASGTPKVAVPVSNTLSGLPFTVTSGNNSFFRLAKSTSYPTDGGVVNVSGTSFTTGVALDTSSPTVFTAMYITAS